MLNILLMIIIFILFIGSFYTMSLGSIQLDELLVLVFYFYLIFYLMALPMCFATWMGSYSLIIRSSLKIVIDNLNLLARLKKDDSEMLSPEKNQIVWFKTTLKMYDSWLKNDYSITIEKMDSYFNTVYFSSLFGSSSDLIEKIIPVLEELFNKADNLLGSIKTLGKFRLEKQICYSTDELTKILAPATVASRVKNTIRSNYEIISIVLPILLILIATFISHLFG